MVEITATPNKVTVPSGTDTFQVELTMVPKNSNRPLVFITPENNKNDFEYDKKTKIITFRRNEKYPEWKMKISAKYTEEKIFCTIPIQFL